MKELIFYENKIIQKTLEDCANFELLNEKQLIENTAESLKEGKLILGFKGGWNLDQEH